MDSTEELSSEQIVGFIQAADLNEISKTRRGDCVSIASAIQEVIGGVLLVFYQSMDREKVLHAVVEIDQVCYDGNGTVGFENLIGTAYIDAKENHDEDVEVIDQHLFEYHESVSSLKIYDEETKQNVKERLETAVRNNS
jgi:hypothetical protein